MSVASLTPFLGDPATVWFLVAYTMGWVGVCMYLYSKIEKKKKTGDKDWNPLSKN